jgi:hypothetical protein
LLEVTPEAIPVRAIPLLTNWRFLTPDVLAQLLAGNSVGSGTARGTAGISSPKWQGTANPERLVEEVGGSGIAGT